jgi:hypothetical protein
MRRFLGLPEVHTGQVQPIMGTPPEVPDPSMVTLIGSNHSTPGRSQTTIPDIFPPRAQTSRSWPLIAATPKCQPNRQVSDFKSCVRFSDTHYTTPLHGRTCKSLILQTSGNGQKWWHVHCSRFLAI